jgi:hypothetical protein
VTPPPAVDHQTVDHHAVDHHAVDHHAVDHHAVDQVGDRLGDHGYQALADPVDDRLFTLLNALTAEVWALRDRLRQAERALGDLGVDVEADWQARRSRPEEIEAMRADRDAFVERVYDALKPRPHR